MLVKDTIFKNSHKLSIFSNCYLLLKMITSYLILQKKEKIPEKDFVEFQTDYSSLK